MNWAYLQDAGGILNKSVLVALANQANSECRCWPGLERLAQRTEASRRAVISSLAELQRRGLISIRRRGGDGKGRKSNLYELAMGQSAGNSHRGNVQEIHKAQQSAGNSHRGNVKQLHQLSALHDRQCEAGSPKQKEEQSKNNHSLGRAGRFEDWWRAYPRKVKKKEAQQIWIQKRLDARADELIADVQARLKQDRQWLGGFIPHPTTYLRGERWDDDIEPPRAEAGNGQTALPKRDEDLEKWAVANGLRGPRVGESYGQYRHALQGEYRRAAGQGAGA